MRCGLAASASTGACGFGATGEGEGKVATSANLGPGMEGGSSASPVSLSIFWVAGTAAAAVYVAGVSPELNQSGGAATMPQTFAGCSSSRSEEHTSELQSRFDLVCRL